MNYCWNYDACVILDGNLLVAEQVYGNQMNLQVRGDRMMEENNGQRFDIGRLSWCVVLDI